MAMTAAPETQQIRLRGARGRQTYLFVTALALEKHRKLI
jgi:hypothetical protein